MEEILEKINQASLSLLKTMTIEDTYTAVVKEAMKLVNAEYGSILIKKNDTLVRVFSSHPFFNKVKIAKGGYLDSAYRKNRIIVNVIGRLPKVNPKIKEMGIQSVIIIPLSYRGDTLGLLAVYSLNKEHFTKKEIDMLRVFGSIATLAVKQSQQFNATKKGIEIRDMFISMAAHELRTPLTSISGYIQLLYNRMSSLDGVEAKWIRSLYDENKRMMNLVEELLEVNRLKTGKAQFIWQECNLDQIIKEAIKKEVEHYVGHDIKYKNKLNKESLVIGDRGRLKQVLENIIDNAIKYSPKNRPVEISLTNSSKFNIISVKDFGRGIEEKDIPYIFEGQHKGGGGEEGMGIGLYFVEKVIRQHRGAINVKSKPGLGTTFEIRLPIVKFYSN